ncbi:MAG: hypothetical protein Q4C77_10305 [Eubacteriales bacterium]|nr:hypothetical protein [Eubacteriales bacterium]
MRSFRKIICRIAVLCIFAVAVNEAGRYLYESVENPVVYARKDLEETKGTVETLLLGSSLIHWGLDPAVISEELDTVCMNLGTDVQPLGGSYFLLKDQIQNNPVKRVFLGMGVAGMVSNTNTLTGRRLAILDRMLSPAVKLEYLIQEGEFKDLEQVLLYPTRVENILNFDLIKSNILYRQSEEFQQGISPESARWQNEGMGFQSNDQVYDGNYTTEKMVRNGLWSRKNIRPEAVEYLTQMAELCHENGIEFNIIIFPHSYEYASMQGDLADMDVYFEEFCSNLGIGLFDYNYTAYEGIYDILPTEYYWDKKHLNKTGAARIAQLLCSEYKEKSES